MKIKGVLFDLDGTLINTTPLILESFRHTFVEFGAAGSVKRGACCRFRAAAAHRSQSLYAPKA